MSGKIMTLHPEGKKGVNISQEKYDQIRGAILNTLVEKGTVSFQRLPDEVSKKLPNFDGSIGWYTTTVKLDLEARRVIERVPHTSPQVLRLVG